MSSSDNILIELVAELYQRTKQSSTLSYEALLLLRPLPLLLVHIGLLDGLMNKVTFLSITNIAQRKLICMATWRLACLILSACPSHTIADTL
ncbi:unnamed protein product [Rotaria sp. Silwood2]|nr:unnamed protein product [Rotaria sp. Silwood2]